MPGGPVLSLQISEKKDSDKRTVQEGTKIPALYLSLFFFFPFSHVLYKNLVTRENLLDTS